MDISNIAVEGYQSSRVCGVIRAKVVGSQEVDGVIRHTVEPGTMKQVPLRIGEGDASVVVEFFQVRDGDWSAGRRLMQYIDALNEQAAEGLLYFHRCNFEFLVPDKLSELIIWAEATKLFS